MQDVKTQMITALKKQDPSLKLEGLSLEALQKLCNEKLYMSLNGNQNWGNSDGFAKQYKYNIVYTLPNGEKIQVEKVKDDPIQLPSGRKVEVFVDIAGNQYFQYRAADDTVLDEKYFKKQEKMLFGTNFRFVDNKLYKTDFIGNFTSVIEDKVERPAYFAYSEFKTKEQKETSQKNLNSQNTTQKVQYHPVYKDLMLDKQGKIDMNQFSLEFLKAKYGEKQYNIKQEKVDILSGFDSYEKISVTSHNGKKILDVILSDKVICSTYKNGMIDNNYTINEKGTVIACTNINSDGSYVKYKYKNDGKTITEYETVDKNGNGKRIIYKDNKVSKVVFFKNKYDEFKKGVKLTKKIFYSNGQPYREVDGEKIVNYAAIKLKDIKYRDKYGYLKIDATKIDELLTIINKDNIVEVLNDYKDMYKEFPDDITIGGYGNKDKINELSAHIESCLLEALGYKKNLSIKNSRVNNEHYQSTNNYDIEFNENKATINNKTTGKKSYIDMGKLLSEVKNPIIKAKLLAEMQKLPGEILEFISYECESFRDFRKAVDGDKIENAHYSNKEEFVFKLQGSKVSTIIHELGHAIDFVPNSNNSHKNSSRTLKGDFNRAFENAITKYKKDGYKIYQPSNSESTEYNELGEDCFYFSRNPMECFARITELLFNGKCEGDEILIKYFSECIDIAKVMINETQKMSKEQRFSGKRPHKI